MVFFKKDGRFSGFQLSGHAEYDDFGLDIVCASITSAVQLAVNTIIESFDIPAEIVKEDNFLSFKIPDSFGKNEPGIRVLESLRVHMDCIAESYEGTLEVDVVTG